MLKGRKEMAESVRKTVSDAGSALIALAVIACCALGVAVAALFIALRIPKAA